MSIDSIRSLLSKMKLTPADDEMAVSAMRADNWIIFTDTSGDTVLITSHDDAVRQLREASRGNSKPTTQTFWSGAWLAGAPFYKGFDALWNALNLYAYEATVPIPKTSERQTIGRVKKLGKDFYLMEAESGEYGLVPIKDTGKWRLE